MTFDDLRRSVTEALSTGKIGTPTSVRFHVQFADELIDLIDAAALACTVFAHAFDAQPSRLFAQSSRDENQLTTLIEYSGGQSAMLTVGRGNSPTPQLQFLLVGNHGVVRLEGGELFQPPVEFPECDDQWRSDVENSLNEQIAVAR